MIAAEFALYQQLCAAAERLSDGHLSVLRFTTNWRVGFVTPQSRDDITRMFVGGTLAEAAAHALEWAQRQPGFANR